MRAGCPSLQMPSEPDVLRVPIHRTAYVGLKSTAALFERREHVDTSPHRSNPTSWTPFPKFRNHLTQPFPELGLVFRAVHLVAVRKIGVESIQLLYADFELLPPVFVYTGRWRFVVQHVAPPPPHIVKGLYLLVHQRGGGWHLAHIEPGQVRVHQLVQHGLSTAALHLRRNRAEICRILFA